MTKIELYPRDMETSIIPSGKYEGTEICQIKFSVAVDPDFIAEMKSFGVREKPIREDE